MYLTQYSRNSNVTIFELNSTLQYITHRLPSIVLLVTSVYTLAERECNFLLVVRLLEPDRSQYSKHIVGSKYLAHAS